MQWQQIKKPVDILTSFGPKKDMNQNNATKQEFAS